MLSVMVPNLSRSFDFSVITSMIYQADRFCIHEIFCNTVWLGFHSEPLAHGEGKCREGPLFVGRGGRLYHLEVIDLSWSKGVPKIQMIQPYKSHKPLLQTWQKIPHLV